MPEDEAVAGVLDVPAEHVVLSSAGRRWHGLDVAEIVHPVDDFAVPALPRHVLVFNLGTPMGATERRSGRAGQLGESGAMILPAGLPRDWHLDRCGEVRHLHLYLDPWLVHGVTAEAGLDPDRVHIPEDFGVRDPQLEQYGLALLAELRSGDPLGRIYADALATVLAVHLLRRHSSATRSAMRGPAGLPPAALKRATEYIEENLAEDLSLAAVARAANLSPYHFARLFKASTGFPPHQYVIRRRVERARRLLATTDRPLAFIAQEVGFASGSHLARHFRRLLGVPPCDYR
jgi:AraC family transcriptional regulator